MSRPRNAPMRDALAPEFERRGDPAAIERLGRALLFGAERRLPEPTAERIAGLLADGVPRTETEIAKKVTRRRSTVAQVLRRDRRFLRVPTPLGRSTRARTWALAFQREGRVGTSHFGDVRRGS
jgi:hypothetical protein